MKHMKRFFWLLLAVSLCLLISPSLADKGGNPDKNGISPDRGAEVRKLLEEIRYVIDKEGYTFTVGDNPALQYPLEQICSLNPNLATQDPYPNESNEEVDLTLALPTYYIGYYSSVKNHGGCGSAWAFVVCGVFEGAIKKKNGTNVDLSEQYLIDCNTYGYGCSGGWFDVHNFHKSPYGARLESCYPYVGYQQTCKTNCPIAYQILSWYYVGSSSGVPTTAAIKDKIYYKGSVAAAVYVNSYFQAYTGGTFNNCGTGSVNHCVILVGWDDARGAWRLKNDWGTGWGESGFMWIKYGCSKIGYAANYVNY